MKNDCCNLVKGIMDLEKNTGGKESEDVGKSSNSSMGLPKVDEANNVEVIGSRYVPFTLEQSEKLRKEQDELEQVLNNSFYMPTNSMVGIDIEPVPASLLNDQAKNKDRNHKDASDSKAKKKSITNRLPITKTQEPSTADPSVGAKKSQNKKQRSPKAEKTNIVPGLKKKKHVWNNPSHDEGKDWNREEVGPSRVSNRINTQRSRDRLNRRFDELLEIIRVASFADKRGSNAAVSSHKSSVLECARDRIQALTVENAKLTVRLLQTCAEFRKQWVQNELTESLKSQVDSANESISVLHEALAGLVGLTLVCFGLKYGELWKPSGTQESSTCNLFKYQINEFERIAEQELIALRKFGDMSRDWSPKAGASIEGRTWASRKPEWIQTLSDVEMFARLNAAKEANLAAFCSIPVRWQGRSVALILLSDPKLSEVNLSVIHFVSEIAQQMADLRFTELLSSASHPKKDRAYW